jgi:hypothetical protein
VRGDTSTERLFEPFPFTSPVARLQIHFAALRCGSSPYLTGTPRRALACVAALRRARSEVMGPALRGGRFWLGFRSRFLGLCRYRRSRDGRRGCGRCRLGKPSRRWGRCIGRRRRRNFGRRRRARLRSRWRGCGRSRPCRARNFAGAPRRRRRRVRGLGRRSRCLPRLSPGRARHS